MDPVVPVWRPHLGPREVFEKKHGLASGASRNIPKPVEVAPVKQQSLPLKHATNAATPQQQEKSHAISFAIVEREAKFTTPTRLNNDGVNWDTYGSWGNSAEPKGHVPLPVIKQEPESPEVTFILSHEDRVKEDAICSPTVAARASGLSASRYASGPAAKPFTTKQEPVPTRSPVVNNVDQTGYVARLADPAEFMSAATKKTSATLAKQVTPLPAQQPVVAKVETQDLMSQFVAAVGEKTLAGRSQPPSWPRFPSSENNVGGAERWGPTNPAMSITGLAESSASPPVEPAISYEEATTAWNTFAAAESKLNTIPRKAVAFVPASAPVKFVETLAVKPPSTNGVNDTSSQARPSNPPKLISAAQYSYNTNGKSVEKQSSQSPAINSKPLSEVINADKVTIRNLTDQLIEQGTEFETIKQELTAYKEERAGLDRELKELQADAEKFKEFKKIQDELAELKTKLATPPSYGSTPSSAQMEWLTTRNKELELENTAMRPMFEIGRDVRACFLEEARFRLLKLEIADVDKEVLSKGHAAAFHANGRADAAAMNGGILTNGQLRHFKPVFNMLYGTDPDQYHTIGDKMKSAMDALGTILTSPACNSAHRSVPNGDMQKVTDFVHIMADKYGRMGPKLFEEDPTGHAAEFLAVIEDSMASIAKFDRKWYRWALKQQLGKFMSINSWKMTDNALQTVMLRPLMLPLPSLRAL